MRRKRRIEEMVVVITGASSGIGRALAEQLSQSGARLVLAARRSERLEALNAALGDGHACVPIDVSDPQQCARLIDHAIDNFGRIDTLVCNAGYGLIRPVVETSGDDILRLMRTNLIGTTECCRAAVPRMLAQEARDGWQGQVVVVSSAAARRGLPDLGAYTATKAAQLSLAEALRVELRGSGIAVTTVHPITTATEFFRAAIRLSGVRPPRRRGIEALQSADAVAAAIVRGIPWPRPEVWPHRRYRLLMGLAAFAPRVVDLILAERRLRRRPRRRRSYRPVHESSFAPASGRDVTREVGPANATSTVIAPLA
jgi:short-subunit dehydrogenase